MDKGFEPGSDDFGRAVDMLDGAVAVELIKALPVAYQKIMTLRYVDDLSLSEIALETGLTKNSVAEKTHRGMEKLRILYEQSLLPK